MLGVWSGVSGVDAAELCSINDRAGVSDECDPAPLMSNSQTTKSEPRSDENNDENNDEKDDTSSQTLPPLLELWVIEEDHYAELCPLIGARALKPDAIEECESALRSLVTRAANSEETTQTPPIRIITEGQTTTFTVPNPSDRRLVTRCANFADERVAPTPQFRADGTLICNYSVAVEKRPGVTVSGNSLSTFGPCRGPYTVEILTPDSRLEHTSGRRIRVTTSNSDNLDDSGSLEIEYFLVGTSTNTFQQTNPGASISTSVSECTLLRTTRVEVRPARRSGMTPAVALHAPSEEYLSTPSTTTLGMHNRNSRSRGPVQRGNNNQYDHSADIPHPKWLHSGGDRGGKRPGLRIDIVPAPGSAGEPRNNDRGGH